MGQDDNHHFFVVVPYSTLFSEPNEQPQQLKQVKSCSHLHMEMHQTAEPPEIEV